MSGDRDFSADLARLAQRGHSIYLVYNHQARETFKHNDYWNDTENYLDLPGLELYKNLLLERKKQKKQLNSAGHLRSSVPTVYEEAFKQQQRTVAAREMRLPNKKSSSCHFAQHCTNPRCELDHSPLSAVEAIGLSMRRKVCSFYKQGRCIKPNCTFLHDDCSECGPGFRHPKNTLQCPKFMERLPQVAGPAGWVQVKDDDIKCNKCKQEFVGPTMMAEAWNHPLWRWRYPTATSATSATSSSPVRCRRTSTWSDVATTTQLWSATRCSDAPPPEEFVVPPRGAVGTTSDRPYRAGDAADGLAEKVPRCRTCNSGAHVTRDCKRKTKTCDYYQTSSCHWLSHECRFLHKCDRCIKDGEFEAHPRKQCPKERKTPPRKQYHKERQANYTPSDTPGIGYVCQVCGHPGGTRGAHWYKFCPAQQLIVGQLRAAAWQPN